MANEIVCECAHCSSKHICRKSKCIDISHTQRLPFRQKTKYECRKQQFLQHFMSSQDINFNDFLQVAHSNKIKTNDIIYEIGCIVWDRKDDYEKQKTLSNYCVKISNNPYINYRNYHLQYLQSLYCHSYPEYLKTKKNRIRYINQYWKTMKNQDKKKWKTPNYTYY